MAETSPTPEVQPTSNPNQETQGSQGDPGSDADKFNPYAAPESNGDEGQEAPSTTDRSAERAEPGTPANTVPELGEPGDPTKYGTRIDMTPLDTRSLGDATAGRDDGDQYLATGNQAERNRQTGSFAGGAFVEVEPKSFEEASPDEMTDEQCKSLLLAYGTDVPASQARGILKDMQDRAKK